MKDHHLRMVLDLIGDFGLHYFSSTGPVAIDINPLQVLYQAHFTPHLGEALGVGAKPIGGIATPETPAHVFLNDELDPNSSRIVYAHEISHLLLGHDGSEPCYEVNPWFHDKQEAEAWAATSIILVPIDALYANGNYDQIATHFAVGPRIVRTALQLWRGVPWEWIPA